MAPPLSGELSNAVSMMFIKADENNDEAESGDLLGEEGLKNQEKLLERSTELSLTPDALNLTPPTSHLRPSSSRLMPLRNEHCGGGTHV